MEFLGAILALAIGILTVRQLCLQNTKTRLEI
jgi:hypothetical protein